MIGVTLIAVFDGVQHPLKGGEVGRRESEAGGTWEKLKALWSVGDISSFEESKRLKLKAGRVPDMIYDAVRHL